MRIWFWIDAGSAVGGGHVTRAEALAAALAARGATCLLLAEDADAVKAAGSGRFAIEALADRSFPDACRAGRPDVAVVDLPHTRPACQGELEALRALRIPSVCFDASDPTRSSADLVVDAVGWGDDHAGRSRRLSGPAYAVLRPGLAGPASERAFRKRTRSRVVLGFGASDPAALTPRALDALAPLGRRIEVDVLMGALAANATVEAVRRRVHRMRRARLHLGVHDPTALLAEADVGVFPFGNLFLEGATTGLPCVLWHPTREHAEVARRFAAHFDAPVTLDGAEAWRSGTGWLQDAVRALMDDPGRRRALSLQARRLLDGRGHLRVAREVSSLVAP